MSPIAIHSVFDVVAWMAAAVIGVAVVRWRPLAFPVAASKRIDYIAAAIIGSAVGAYLFGTLNLWASGVDGFGRSIEGAIFGGILAIEIFKRMIGIESATGARFAAPLAIGVAVGRFGCFFAGLEDFTYGTQTDLPWGVDFGDGVMRHPVQLYESAAMTGFLAAYLIALERRNEFWAREGFYLAVSFYGAQRFLWEFLKPYGSVLGSLTTFHLLSIALVAYAAVMIRRSLASPMQTIPELNPRSLPSRR
jgi:prolipoprotein diacylglyceryltransferase